jgi:hypothetical protein
MKPFVLIAASVAALASVQAQAQPQTIVFNMTVSTGASTCLPLAAGTVIIHSFGSFENMEVAINGLPPNTDFDLFSIEVPNKPFGLAWYNGDILTDSQGVGVIDVVGRFSRGTFVISPGIPATPPPNVFPDPPAFVPEATVGIATNPVQLYHLGVWFDSAADAAKAGCPNTSTPFNSVHNAGIQVLNTANFPDTPGPLFNLQ